MPGIRTGCSTRTATAASRTGRRSSVPWSAGSSIRGGMSRAVARGDAARMLRSRPLERTAGHRRPVPPRGAATRAARRRAHRELGPHGRQGSHLAVLRPLRRPEPGHAGRSTLLPRDRTRAVRVTGWPQTDLLHRRRSRSEYESLLRALALDSARPWCSWRATRRATRRTRAGSSSAFAWRDESHRDAAPAAVSPASPRPRLACTVRARRTAGTAWRSRRRASRT